jgi:hypothetical protein
MKEHKVIRIKSEEDGCEYVCDIDTGRWRKEYECTGLADEAAINECRLGVLLIKVLEGRYKAMKNANYTEIPRNRVEGILESAGIGLSIKYL